MFDKKFALELNKCVNHEDIIGTYECPICKLYYCQNCIKILQKEKDLIKYVCQRCWWRYLLKTIITLISLGILISFYFFFIREYYTKLGFEDL
jgi:hypothetical protein